MTSSWVVLEQSISENNRFSKLEKKVIIGGFNNFGPLWGIAANQMPGEYYDDENQLQSVKTCPQDYNQGCARRRPVDRRRGVFYGLADDDLR